MVLVGIAIALLIPRVCLVQAESRAFFEETKHWYPITEVHLEDGQVIQYFQRLKLQWKPDNSIAPMIVGNLGEIHFDIHGYRMPPEALATPVDARAETTLANTPANINGLRVIVSVCYSVLSLKRNQMVSVLATDNNGNPLQGAHVEIRFVKMPTNVILSGSHQPLITDSQGFAQISLPVNEGRPGRF